MPLVGCLIVCAISLNFAYCGIGPHFLGATRFVGWAARVGQNNRSTFLSKICQIPLHLYFSITGVD